MCLPFSKNKRIELDEAISSDVERRAIDGVWQMADAGNVIIDDSYCTGMGSVLYRYGHQLNEKLVEYSDILHAMRTDSLKEGEVGEALDTFLEYVDQLKGELSSISATADDRADDFIASVDEADEDLY